MKVTFRASLLRNGWLTQVLKGYAQRCDLAVRKAALPLTKEIEQLTKAYTRSRAELEFLYGKEAPANYPNAGARLLEASLMSQEEWKEFTTKSDELDDCEHTVEWLETRPKVEIPANVLKKVSQDELDSSELFFEIVEGPDEAEAKKK